MAKLITLDQFIRKYAGLTCKHPRGIAGQCVCLYRCYLDEVLGVSQTPSVVGARNLWAAASATTFVKIPNTITGVPQRGDIVIFDAFKGNPNGHVAIVVSANVLKMQTFDSNWSLPKRARLESHGYIRPRCIGWLRKR